MDNERMVVKDNEILIIRIDKNKVGKNKIKNVQRVIILRNKGEIYDN